MKLLPERGFLRKRLIDWQKRRDKERGIYKKAFESVFEKERKKFLIEKATKNATAKAHGVKGAGSGILKQLASVNEPSVGQRIFKAMEEKK